MNSVYHFWGNVQAGTSAKRIYGKGDGDANGDRFKSPGYNRISPVFSVLYPPRASTRFLKSLVLMVSSRILIF